jgi:hypothetical protein
VLHYNKLEWDARDRHSCLMGLLISCEENDML